MKISIKWLKELLPGLKATPQKIASELERIGIEIEATHDFGAKLDPLIVIAEVLSLEKHPQADRLNVCKVSTGKETLQIVCGAANVKAGGKYPLALIGAKLPSGLEIKQACLRSVDSFGMLCSEKELRLTEASEGLLTLPNETSIGKSFSKIYGDTILELAIPANRGDLLSHWGIAREVAPLFGLKFVGEKQASKKRAGEVIGKRVKVTVQDKGYGRQACGRYTSRIISGVKISPSPFLVSQRLKSLGIRPINNVVDATNYVMMETGHPLHVFDARDLKDGKIIVRKAGADNFFETLDGQKRELLPDDLVIADAEKVIALAGIMGGKNSEVKNDTTDLVLEAASFNAVKIRQTARRLSLHTDSSHRFERFVNPQSVLSALQELTDLIVTWAGGVPSKDCIDVFSNKKKTTSVTVRRERLNKILGITLSTSEIGAIFKLMGLEVKSVKNGLKVVVPSYRNDLEREIDLIEEIVRYTGFSKIPSVLPKGIRGNVYESAESKLEATIKKYFSGQGFLETIHYSFGSPNEFAKAGFSENLLELENPLSQDLSVMRPSLLPLFLQSYAKNSKQDYGCFEIGSIYGSDFGERSRLSFLLNGASKLQGWTGQGANADFYTGKGILEKLFSEGRCGKIDWVVNASSSLLHPGQSVILKAGDKILGSYGKLHPQLLQKFEIKEPLYFADLDYSLLSKLWGQAKYQFQAISAFPGIARDLALVMDQSMAWATIERSIQELNPPLLKKVSVFDVYSGDKVAEGKKSLALSLYYEDSLKTLTDEEVNKVHFALVEALQTKLQVTLRSSL